MSAFKKFETARDLKGFLHNCVVSKGSPDTSGIEEEIVVLKENGKPFSLEEYQSFVKELVLGLPGGELAHDENLTGTIPLIKGGRTEIGSVNPETNTMLIEFAHKPVTTSHELHQQSQSFGAILKKTASRNGCYTLGYGLVPSIEWDDFWTYQAI